MIRRRIVPAILAATMAAMPVSVLAQGPAPSAAPAAPVVAEPPAPAEVKLIDAGAAEGRVQLRMRPKAGETQYVSMRMKMEMEGEMNGQEMPAIPMPGTQTNMRITIEKVDENGDIHYSMAVDGVELFDTEKVQPMMVSMVKEQLEEMKELRGSMVTTSRGVVKSGSFKGADDGSPFVKQTLESMNQTMAQISMPLPEEAVGMGAKWQVTTRPTINGISTENTGVFTVLEMKPGSVRVSVEQLMSAKAQDVVSPVMPEAKTHLKSLKGGGKGKMLIDLARPVSQDAEISSDVKIEMNVSIQGQSMDLAQNVKTQMKLVEGKPASAPAKPEGEKASEPKK